MSADFRYDERTGMFVGVPQMLPMRPFAFDPEKLTREQRIRWAVAYLASRAGRRK